MSLSVGTKSVLFGAHCFFLHPWFVAAAWAKLYGFRRVTCPSTKVSTSLLDWRLWLCFVVHDWGYWGCPDMDGEKGERHPEVGAVIVQRVLSPRDTTGRRIAGCWTRFEENRWHDFVLYHSRWYASRARRIPSALCMADKLSLALTPAWIYVPLARASGEIHEYRTRETRPETSKNWRDDTEASDYDWWRRVQSWTKAYVTEHRDGRVDTWTPREGVPE